MPLIDNHFDDFLDQALENGASHHQDTASFADLIDSKLVDDSALSMGTWCPSTAQLKLAFFLNNLPRTNSGLLLASQCAFNDFMHSQPFSAKLDFSAQEKVIYYSFII